MYGAVFTFVRSEPVIRYSESLRQLCLLHFIMHCYFFRFSLSYWNLVKTPFIFQFLRFLSNMYHRSGDPGGDHNNCPFLFQFVKWFWSVEVSNPFAATSQYMEQYMILVQSRYISGLCWETFVPFAQKGTLCVVCKRPHPFAFQLEASLVSWN